MAASTRFNPAARYVRVVGHRAGGMVEFEFAVGEPELYVEMLMPQTQFDDFCAQLAVRPTQGALPPSPPDSDARAWDWNLRAAQSAPARGPR